MSYHLRLPVYDDQGTRAEQLLYFSNVQGNWFHRDPTTARALLAN